MPELPEVETIRRRLEPALVGRSIVGAEIFDARLTRPEDPDAVAHELHGEQIMELDRRGKYLVVRFESGRALVIHLRMTGSLRLFPDGRPDEDAYRRALLKLDDGSAVGYRDVRRFGTWVLFEVGEVAEYLAERLGPEPLGSSWTAADFATSLARRSAPVKAVILDQRVVAGVGNIYADEALWRAHIHPLREARTLDAGEVAALRRTIREVLRLGIKRQGSTLRDYGLPDGDSGGMQREFRVYGREGEPCERCGTPIEKTRAGGRGTWFCPACQRRGHL